MACSRVIFTFTFTFTFTFSCPLGNTVPALVSPADQVRAVFYRCVALTAPAHGAPDKVNRPFVLRN